MKFQTKEKLIRLTTDLRPLILGLAVVSIVTYLIVINHTNTLGIEIGEMQYKIGELKDQYRDLEAVSTELQAMQRIEAISNLELSMVQAETYDYILPSGETVAAK
jgi:cell division protein FtsL